MRAVLGTLVLIVPSCAPDDAVKTPPEASDPELEFQQQLEALRFGVEYLAEWGGHEKISLATYSGQFRERGGNVLRDRGRDAEDVLRRLADELGSGFEARSPEETPSCSAEGCEKVGDIPVYLPTLAHFSDDLATVHVTTYYPSNVGVAAVYMQRTSDGWVVERVEVGS